MADYNSLKATIDANIRANGVQAITGPVLNACLKAMITVLGNGYQLQGSIAQPGDDPSVPDARVAYVASGPGTYTDFGGVVIPDDGHAYMLTWDTQWTAVQLPVPTSAALAALATVVAGKQDILTFDPSPVSGSQNPVTSGGIFSAIEHAKGAAGLAEALLDTDSEGAEQEFSLRKSGGDGGAYFRRLLGNTKAFNQLIDIPSSDASKTENGVTITDNRDGSFSVVTDANGATATTQLQLSCPLTNGHTYLLRGCPSGGSGSSYRLYMGSMGSDYGDGFIFTASSTGSVSFPRIYISSGLVISTPIVFRPQVFDLTAMQDNSTTPEEFREKYPLLYYAYGRKLIHNKVAKVITKGANQWDEVWELGSIGTSTGTNTPSSSHIRSKNYIPVFPSVTYYNKGYNLAILGYDADKNFVGVLGNIAEGTFTIPSNVYYIRFYRTATSYANDICINLSDAEINGQYFPYWERELALDITNQEDTDGNKPFAEGMMGAGSAADYANEVGGAKVMGKVKFSDLSWEYESNGRFRSLSLDGLANPSTIGTSEIPNIVCDKYVPDTALNLYNRTTDKTIWLGRNGYFSATQTRLYVYDSGYTDVATFLAAMGDAELVYEKAAPVPFTWKEPLNTGIKVSKYGTEEITPAQTENIDTAPFRAVTTYSISIATLVAALHGMGFRGAKSNPAPEPEEPKEEIPVEEQPKEEEPKEEETPVVEPEVQNKK